MLAILLFTSFFVLGMGDVPNSADVDSKAPDFTLKDLNGNEVKLSSILGEKTIVLNFFRVECPSCKREIPSLQQLNNEYRTKNVEIISINLRDSKESVKDFVEYFNINHIVLLDETGKVGREYNFRYVPSNFIINKDGKIVYKGLYTSLEKFKSELDKIIK